MNCNCINTVDEGLAERNMELDKTFLLGGSGSVMLSISTHWKDTNKKPRGQKPTVLLVKFCPFCGMSAEAGSETSE